MYIFSCRYIVYRCMHYMIIIYSTRGCIACS